MLSFMYVPPAFAVDQRDFALNLIARYPFGLLTTCDERYPQATHLPMLARLDGDDLVIAGHVARANPHARAILEGRPATAVFSGPHAYVSAAWYETPPSQRPDMELHCRARVGPAVCERCRRGAGCIDREV